MIEPFEAAVADLLADRIGSAPEVGLVIRWRDGLADPPSTAARVAVRIGAGRPVEAVGIGRPEIVRDGPARRPRLTVELAGDVMVEVEIGSADNEADQADQRRLVMAAADQVLVALHDDAVRDGRQWGDDHAQGFAIDCFQLTEILPGSGNGDDSTVGYRRIDVRYNYHGRFWPIEPLVDGDLIEAPIRLRSLVADAVLPRDLVARASGPAVDAPVLVDLSVLGGAVPRLSARLVGSEPAGQLLGNQTGIPAGSFGYLPDESGRYVIRFQPADVVPTDTTARIDVSLTADRDPGDPNQSVMPQTVVIGRIAIVVKAGG